MSRSLFTVTERRRNSEILPSICRQQALHPPNSYTLTRNADRQHLVRPRWSWEIKSYLSPSRCTPHMHTSTESLPVGIEEKPPVVVHTSGNNHNSGRTVVVPLHTREKKMSATEIRHSLEADTAGSSDLWQGLSFVLPEPNFSLFSAGVSVLGCLGCLGPFFSIELTKFSGFSQFWEFWSLNPRYSSYRATTPSSICEMWLEISSETATAAAISLIE